MANNKLMKSPVRILSSGSYGRLYTAPPNRIRGLEASSWFGPSQPVTPIAPPGTEPRGYNYTPGQNLIYTPRSTEDLTADDLREFSKYPVVRYIIETRKDQICRQSWSVRVKPKPGETNKERIHREAGDKVIESLTNFFNFPSPDCSWRDFLRMWMEDVLVIDAPAILLRRNRAGDIGEMRAIDGATIARYIDDNGWTPQGNNPAYAQLWYGMPMVDLSTDQLVYRPSNPRTNKLYGLSRVEQAYKHIILGQSRLEMQLQFYENGSIPDGIMVVPPTATPEQIERQQNWMNSTLAGNLARRVQLRLIQGFNMDGKPEQILFPKERLLADETDDLIIRSLCFAFQVSPQRWMKMVNRASAEASQEAAEEEGLAPTKDYIRDVCNYIIQVKLGFNDHEFSWADHRDPDILKQAQADEIYVRTGINTVNEVRDSKGDDPSPNPAADQLNVVTGQGTVEVGQTLPSKQAEQLAGTKSGTGGRPGGATTATGTTQKPKSGGSGGAQTAATSKNPPKKKPTSKKVEEGEDLSKGYEFASTQINLPDVYAEEIIELGKSLIPDEDLAFRGRELEPHVTVKYGVEEDAEALAEILKSHQPIEIMLGPVMTFEATEFSEGSVPVVIRVVSADLRKMRRDVNAGMSAREDNFDYTPHVTLAYVKPECAQKYVGAANFEDVKFYATSVLLSKTDGEKVEVPIGLGRPLANSAGTRYRKAAAAVPLTLTLDPHHFTPAGQSARNRIEDKLRSTLTKCGEVVVSQISAVSKEYEAAKLYARMGVLDKDELTKAKQKARKDIEVVLDDNAIWDEIWADLPADIQPELADAILAGMNKGAVETGLRDPKATKEMLRSAMESAKKRAAEMVGKTFDAQGKLVDNPRAEMVISNTTRDELKKLIATAIEDESSTDELARAIRSSTTLDADRARFIARTEVARAQTEGNVEAWRKTGQVKTVRWQTSNMPNTCDQCLLNEAAGEVEFGTPFPSGALWPQEHPNCRCILVTVRIGP